MALNDLTGQNIQDTYQKVVQTDGTNLANGTGSLLPISFEGNDVIIPGALRAQSYIVSESIVNVSSGSTLFGNSHDDTHTFSGSVDVKHFVDTNYNTTNPILYLRQRAVNGSSVSSGFGGSIDFHVQRGANTTGVRSGRIESYLISGHQSTADYWGMNFEVRSNDTIHPAISIYSTATGGDIARVGILDTTPSYTLDVNGGFRSTGNAILGNSTSSHTINGKVNQIISTGLISGSDQVRGASLRTDEYLIGNLNHETQLVVGGPITSSGISSSGNLEVGGNIVATGTIGGSNIETGASLSGINTGDQSLTHLAITSSDVLFANITASGNISSSGVITANRFDIDGNKFAAVGSSGTFDIGQTGQASLNLTHVTASGNISSSGTGSFGRVEATTLNGTLTTATQTNITSVGTLTGGSIGSGFGSINVGGNAISTTGTVTTGPIVATNNIDLTTANGHITASGNISASGTIEAGESLTVKNQGSVNVYLQSTGNNNSVINFLNNQEPDFLIGNYFGDGGFQIRSEEKVFLIIGANDGDEVVVSGSLHTTGSHSHITASGNISSSGNIVGVLRSKAPQFLTANMGAADISAGEVYVPLAEGELEGSNQDHPRVNMVAPCSGSLKKIVARTNSAWGANTQITASLYTLASGENTNATAGEGNGWVTQSRCYFNAGNPAYTTQTAVHFDFDNPDTGSSVIGANDRVNIGFVGNKGSIHYYLTMIFEWDYTEL